MPGLRKQVETLATAAAKSAGDDDFRTIFASSSSSEDDDDDDDLSVLTSLLDGDLDEWLLFLEKWGYQAHQRLAIRDALLPLLARPPTVADAPPRGL